MTRLRWTALPNNYERGVDRGVLYFGQNEYSVWDGLVSVQEQATQSQGRPRFFDGVVYSIDQEIADFQASVEAITFPYMLEDHVLALGDGLTYGATSYETRPFGFTYRTERQGGYKIHLVYNIIATIETIEHQTLSSEATLTPFRFTLHTTPESVPGGRPSSHLYADTTIASPEHIFQLEKILYGSEDTSPRWPSVQNLVDLFSN